MQTAAASSKPKAVKPDNPPSNPKLYWNEQGAVCCGVHAPYQGSDTWEFERWKELSPGERRAWLAATGKHAECEVGIGCGDRS